MGGDLMLTQMIPLQMVQCVYHQDHESHRVLALAAMTAQQYSLESHNDNTVQLLASEDSDFLGMMIRSVSVHGLDSELMQDMEEKVGWIFVNDTDLELPS